jgi:SAM-dependent methyltransferase
MTPEFTDLLATWEEMSAGYLPDRQHLIESLINEVQDRTSRPTVLDLGCGPGTLLAQLGASVPGVSLIGIDNDPVLLELALAQLSSVGVPFTLIDAPLDSRWPDRLDEITNGGVDVVLAVLVVHYFEAEQWQELFRQVRSVLRPGGCFVIIDVDGHSAAVGNPEALDWRQWWQMAAASEHPKLKAAFDERKARITIATAEHHPDPAAIERIAALAGFATFHTARTTHNSYLAIAGTNPSFRR